MPNTSPFSTHIQTLSVHYGVDALAVVALLAVHALCKADFAHLTLLRNVANELHAGLGA